MRVTAAMQMERFVHSLRNLRERLASESRSLASGKRLNVPSDDPGGAGEVVRIRSRLADIERRATHASTARGFLAVTESALDGVQNLLAQARAAALRGASDVNAGTREEIAREVEGVRAQVLAAARTRFDERYVFAGTETRTPPFDDSGAYAGNAGSIQIETGANGETTTLNLTGAEAFGSGASSVFAALDQLVIDVRAGDVAAIQAGAIRLEDARRDVGRARSVVGDRLERLAAQVSWQADLKVILATQASAIEDADIAATITRLTQLDTSQQATLAAGARTLSHSLFDYLA